MFQKLTTPRRFLTASSPLALALFIGIASNSTHATVVVSLQQDFSSSASLVDYIGSDANQFTLIHGATGTVDRWSIVSSAPDNALQGFRDSGGTSGNTTGTNGGLQKNDLGLANQMVVVQFDLQVTTWNSVSTSMPVLFIGSGFAASPTAGYQPTNESFARMQLQFTALDTFRMRTITEGEVSDFFTGKQTLTWLVNNTGVSQNYDLGGGISGSLGDDSQTVWVGSTNAISPTGVGINADITSIQDFRLAWNASNATVEFDNFVIGAVPEPSTYALFLGLGALGLVLARRNRRNH